MSIGLKMVFDKFLHSINIQCCKKQITDVRSGNQSFTADSSRWVLHSRQMNFPKQLLLPLLKVNHLTPKKRLRIL